MRTFLVVGVLVVLCSSANAATRWPGAKSRDTAVRRSVPNLVNADGVRVYRDATAPGGLRTDKGPPPAYNDPSKFGGG